MKTNENYVDRYDANVYGWVNGHSQYRAHKPNKESTRFEAAVYVYSEPDPYSYNSYIQRTEGEYKWLPVARGNRDYETERTCVNVSVGHRLNGMHCDVDHDREIVEHNASIAAVPVKYLK